MYGLSNSPSLNAAAIGERWSGSAKGTSNFVFLALGTGIGSGIVLNGHLYHGSDWAAGEVGYLLVPGEEVSPILMKEPGALEKALGGNAIEERWRQASRGDGVRLRATEIFELAAHGNASARKLLHSSAQVLANAIINICVLINPSLIILGGSLGTSEPLVDATRELLDKNDFAMPRLAISTLGAEAQLHGAIRLALDHVEASLLP